MHSSRMRTVCCSGCLGGGGSVQGGAVCPGGVCLEGVYTQGVSAQGVYTPLDPEANEYFLPPPPPEQND